MKNRPLEYAGAAEKYALASVVAAGLFTLGLPAAAQPDSEPPPSSDVPATGSAPAATDSGPEAPPPDEAAKADQAIDKPRFDFYKILPGSEEPKVQTEGRKDKEKATDRAVVEQARDRTAPDKTVVAKAPERLPDRAADTAAPAKPGDRFWLQAGSFATEADAENLKARLAFAGWQAIVQQGTVPDKGTRYRVRLGPYDNTDELTRIRNDLAKNGFDVAVIKF